MGGGGGVEGVVKHTQNTFYHKQSSFRRKPGRNCLGGGGACHVFSIYGRTKVAFARKGGGGGFKTSDILSFS